MNLRMALFELAAAYRLDAAGLQRLQELAGLQSEPAALQRWLVRSVAVLAAALGGLGVILWMAANWETFGHFGRFALLQSLVLVMCLGAWRRPAARVPLGLLALIGIGGVFACFGQTYQTGADPWQLFALWAVLSLPLCVGVRSDVLWTPWTLVAMVAIALWTQAHAGHRWFPHARDLGAHLISWTAIALLIAGLRALPQGLTGAGNWSVRTAVILGVIQIGSASISWLFASDAGLFVLLGLLALVVGAVAFARPVLFDAVALSAIALGINSLLVAALTWIMFESRTNDFVIPLLLIGLVAAGLLAASVSGILYLSRNNSAAGGQA